MRQDYRLAVREVTEVAVGASFDGCHKIYIHMDDGAHEESRRIGYGDGTDDSVLVDFGAMPNDEREGLIVGWFEQSCGLRFVHTIRGVGEAVVFGTPVPQGGDDGYE